MSKPTGKFSVTAIFKAKDMASRVIAKMEGSEPAATKPVRVPEPPVFECCAANTHTAACDRWHLVGCTVPLVFGLVPIALGLTLYWLCQSN